MHFVLYAEKNLNECRKALTERMHVKGTPSKPGIDGWQDKNNSFMWSVNAPVIGRIKRRTNLRARLEKETGYTVIRGDVPSGAPLLGILLMLVALGAVAYFLISSGSAIPGFVLIALALFLVIILRGDDQNSDYLLDEIMKSLNAKPTPPKVAPKKSTTSTGTTPAVSSSSAPRPGGSPSASTPKPPTSSTLRSK
jgi:hypothetical protein